MLAVLPLLFISLQVALQPNFDVQIEPAIAKIHADNQAERFAGAQALSKLPPEAIDALAKRLRTPRAISAASFRALVLGIWAQVPNWQSGDPMWIQKPEAIWTPPPRVAGQPRAKKPPPHDADAIDWLTALNDLNLGDPEFAQVLDREEARKQAIEMVALLRALSATGRSEATAPIFQFAFELEGVFRDECGRQIRALDGAALPVLIQFMYDKSHANAKQRRYAGYQLDRMDRGRPSKAIAAAPDDRLRAATIHAYGEARAIDAVESVLDETDSPSLRVRKEARWGWSRYVSGKAPPPAPKRKRKLPGGRTEDKETPDYLTYREIAELALGHKLEKLTAVKPRAKATAQELTDELLALYDRRHAMEWDAVFEGANEKIRRGDLAAAIEDFNAILAREPSYPRRAEMAATFFSMGEGLRSSDRARAELYLREAYDLAPDGAYAKLSRSRVLLLDGIAASERGLDAELLFQEAITLDPALDDARNRIRIHTTAHRHLLWLLGAFGCIGAALLLWRIRCRFLDP